MVVAANKEKVMARDTVNTQAKIRKIKKGERDDDGNSINAKRSDGAKHNVVQVVATNMATPTVTATAKATLAKGTLVVMEKQGTAVMMMQKMATMMTTISRTIVISMEMIKVITMRGNTTPSAIIRMGMEGQYLGKWLETVRLAGNQPGASSRGID